MVNVATLEWADTTAAAMAAVIGADPDPKAVQLAIDALDVEPSCYELTCDAQGWDPLAVRDLELRAWAWRRYDT